MLKFQLLLSKSVQQQVDMGKITMSLALLAQKMGITLDPISVEFSLIT
jgi:hypothetical protein